MCWAEVARPVCTIAIGFERGVLNCDTHQLRHYKRGRVEDWYLSSDFFILYLIKINAKLWQKCKKSMDRTTCICVFSEESDQISQIRMVDAVNSKETGTIPGSRILKPFWRRTYRSSPVLLRAAERGEGVGELGGQVAPVPQLERGPLKNVI